MWIPRPFDRERGAGSRVQFVLARALVTIVDVAGLFPTSCGVVPRPPALGRLLAAPLGGSEGFRSLR